MPLNMNIVLVELSDTLRFQIPSLCSPQYYHQGNHTFCKGLILHSFSMLQSRISSCSVTGMAIACTKKGPKPRELQQMNVHSYKILRQST